MKKPLIALFACAALCAWAEPAKADSKKPGTGAKVEEKKSSDPRQTKEKPADKAAPKTEEDKPGTKPAEGPPPTK